jgi:hypothetical protein
LCACSLPLRATQRATVSHAPRMAYSPVPTPEGTKNTYWETKAPSSDVLGIGKNVPAASYVAASVIAAAIGGYCTSEVQIFTFPCLSPCSACAMRFVPSEYGAMWCATAVLR